jgi:hypothetical protein
VRSDPQLVATGGNGFRLFLRLRRRSDLPLIAIGYMTPAAFAAA